MSQEHMGEVTASDAERAFTDGTYKTVPDQHLRQLERACINASSQNPAFRQRIEAVAHRFHEELKEREARRLALAGMPTIGAPEASAVNEPSVTGNGDATSWDEAKLRALVTASVPESLTMEYKRAGALAREPRAMDEITKDVSAMANSAGGTLIYGVAEDPGTHNLSIDGVDGAAFSREWLEQIVSQVSPRIAGLRIFPINVGPANDRIVYVIEVPPGATAHQARDLRYYRRHNFQSVAMYDHEIRDVMSRTRHPKLVIKAELVVYPTQNAEGNHGVLALRIMNDSDVFARYLSVVVDAPPRVAGRYVHYRNAAYERLASGTRYRCSFSNHTGPPLFPKAVLMPLFPFQFVTPVGPQPKDEPELDHFQVVAFADSMPKKSVVFQPGDILRSRGASVEKSDLM
jgi:hypothetical protein